MNWDELEATGNALFQEQRYAEAYHFTKQNEHFFPFRRWYYNWLICSAAGFQLDLAIEETRKALESGFWFGEAILQGDEELEPLQPLPEYQQLMAISRARRVEAQTLARPELLVWSRAAQEEPHPLLMALHGNMRSIANSLAEWHSVIDQGWLLAMPQSSQIDEPDSYVWNKRELALQEVMEHYCNVAQSYRLAQDRQVIAGFSTSAGIAVELVVKGSLPVRGFIAIAPSPYHLSDEILAELQAHVKTHGLPAIKGYIIVGAKDQACYEVAQKVKDLFASGNRPCEIELHQNLGHNTPTTFPASLAHALNFLTR